MTYRTFVRSARNFEESSHARKTLRAEVEDWQRIAEHNKDACEAIIAAVLGAVGGTVEGNPTNAFNYLQRLRELAQVEVERDKLRADVERLRAERDEQDKVSCEVYRDA